ncbi:MAG TPA: hypothetical protein VIF88_13465 [Methylocystis sp.]
MSAPRKRRLDRLSISAALGATKGWSPTDTDWRGMEKEYGMTRGEDFGDDLRGKIRSAVLEYFEWEPFEMCAPFSKDFKEKLVKAKGLATELREVVNEFGDAGPLVAAYWEQRYPGEPEEVHCNASADEDDAAIFENAFATESHGNCKRRGFKDTVFDIRAIIDHTLREIAREDFSRFSEGEAWTVLIERLASAFRDAKKSVSASKDPSRKLSPFVRFVKALQSTFDDEFRRHDTDAGLSLAVSQALNSNTKSRKTGAKHARRAEDNLPRSPKKSR